MQALQRIKKRRKVAAEGSVVEAACAETSSSDDETEVLGAFFRRLGWRSPAASLMLCGGRLLGSDHTLLGLVVQESAVMKCLAVFFPRRARIQAAVSEWTSIGERLAAAEISMTAVLTAPLPGGADVEAPATQRGALHTTPPNGARLLDGSVLVTTSLGHPANRFEFARSQQTMVQGGFMMKMLAMGGDPKAGTTDESRMAFIEEMSRKSLAQLDAAAPKVGPRPHADHSTPMSRSDGRLR